MINGGESGHEPDLLMQVERDDRVCRRIICACVQPAVCTWSYHVAGGDGISA